MFVYSLRASTVKFIGILLLCACGMLILFSIAGSDDAYAQVAGEEINYGNIKTNEDRISFIEKFGVKVKDVAVKEENFSMPDDFDRVIAGYNEIQKRQGLDLTKYKNKRVTHYMYEVTNYDSEGIVYVNLCIYKNRIVACDISSADPTGFVRPLVTQDPKNLK